MRSNISFHFTVRGNVFELEYVQQLFRQDHCSLLGYPSLLTTAETGLRTTQHLTEWTHRGCFPGAEAVHSLLSADIWSMRAPVDMFSWNDVLCFFCSTKLYRGRILIIYDLIYASSRMKYLPKC